MAHMIKMLVGEAELTPGTQKELSSEHCSLTFTCVPRHTRIMGDFLRFWRKDLTL